VSGDRFRRTRRPSSYDGVVRMIPRLVRYLWAAPTTAVGLAIVVAASRGAEIRVVDGVLEAHGPALAWLLSRSPFTPGGAWAMTVTDASSLLFDGLLSGVVAVTDATLVTVPPVMRPRGLVSVGG